MTWHLQSAHPSSDGRGRKPASVSYSVTSSCSTSENSIPSQEDHLEAEKENIAETLQGMLKEFQTLETVKTLLRKDVDFRVFFDTQSDILGDQKSEDKSKLVNAFNIMLQMQMARSQSLIQTKSNQISPDKSSTTIGTVSQNQKTFEHKFAQFLTDSSISRLSSGKKNDITKNLKTKARNSQVVAADLMFLDKAHAALLQAEGSVCGRAGQLADRQSHDKTPDNGKTLENQEAENSITRLDLTAVSSKDHNIPQTRAEINEEEQGALQNIQVQPQQLQPKTPEVVSLQQNEVTVQVNSSSEIDKAATLNQSTCSSQEMESEDADTSTPLPLFTPESSKLYGNMDFQEIAQRASRSNPDATTITVVQDTGGNRPPTTVHFKKSYKSNAIIPTGESLGIKSPFLSKEYTGSKIFACKECHSRYKTKNELERHTDKKHRKKKCFLCEICGSEFARRTGMESHMMRKHGGASELKCDVCDYVTRSEIRLLLHVKKHNKDESEFFCQPCNKKFVSESKLRKHQRSPMHKNVVDPIICEHCGYVTKKRDNFLVHLRKHTGEKPYKCKHCNYAAADGSTLKVVSIQINLKIHIRNKRVCSQETNASTPLPDFSITLNIDH